MRHTMRASLLAVFLARGALAQMPDAPLPPPPPEEDPEGIQPPPSDAVPPAQPPDLEVFQRGLAPYGQWTTVDDVPAWQPVNVAPDWRPYADGTWIPTDAGWAFTSGDPWGWACYHYGRWGFAPGIGWYWVPGFTWAPAWVSWRVNGGYVAWSALPPARYRPRGAWPGWVSVPAQHFTHPIREHRMPPHATEPIVRNARPAHPTEWAPLRGPYGRRHGEGHGAQQKPEPHGHEAHPVHH